MALIRHRGTLGCMTTYLAESLSDCCGALVTVEGRTTHYYKCTACGKACDLAGGAGDPAG